MFPGQHGPGLIDILGQEIALIQGEHPEILGCGRGTVMPPKPVGN